MFLGFDFELLIFSGIYLYNFQHYLYYYVIEKKDNNIS